MPVKWLHGKGASEGASPLNIKIDTAQALKVLQSVAQDEIPRRKKAGLNRVGTLFAAQVVHSMSGINDLPPTGLWKISKGSYRTGRLISSVKSEMVGDDSVRAFTNIKYAPYIEQGWTTSRGNKVPAKPHFAHTLMRYWDDLNAQFLEAFKRG